MVTGMRDSRRFKATHGEKEPFHASILFTTRADGVIDLPPMVVHQAGETGGDSSNRANLPEFSMVDQNPAGYMDQRAFRNYMAAVHDVVRNGPNAHDDPVFFFVDGHESHMNPGLRAELAKLKICLIIIPSHTSNWFAPNDNGTCGAHHNPHACMHACTHDTMAHSMRGRPCDGRAWPMMALLIA